MTIADVPNSAPLSVRLSELLDALRVTREELDTVVQSVPDELLARRSDADSWSVAENIEHLAIIEGGIGRLISNFAKQLRGSAAPLATEDTTMMGCLDVFGATALSKKLVAPESFLPTGTAAVTESLEQLWAIRARLIAAVHAADGLDFSQVSAPHPFFGPMNGYQWLLLIGHHEKRHVQQMKDTVKKLVQGTH